MTVQMSTDVCCSTNHYRDKSNTSARASPTYRGITRQCVMHEQAQLLGSEARTGTGVSLMAIYGWEVE